MALYVGLMSGTSLDGTDGVLAEMGRPAPRVLAHSHRRFDEGLRAELLALNDSGAHELHRCALAANALVLTYADVVQDLLLKADVGASEIQAVAAHGQTVRHRPGEFDGVGYTVQLMNGALLAERTGIDVVCDFRSRDVAAGGQGAPLVPAFHAALFGDENLASAVLNLGGIANLTLLPFGGPVGGFDCGPGNALMDAWCQAHLGQAFDAEGRWAASGNVDSSLLAYLQAEPYFSRRPPKSTGRDLFNPEWMHAALRAHSHRALRPVDVQATLAELTVWAAAQAIQTFAPTSQRLLVCGGGAFNNHLLARLAALLPGLVVSSTASCGVPPDQVEALAFAWLGWAFTQGLPANLCAATGASGPRVLGALYPAG